MTSAGEISDIIPVIMGDKPVDWIYELDGDYDRRYTTDEMDKLLNSGEWEQTK